MNNKNKFIIAACALGALSTAWYMRSAGLFSQGERNLSDEALLALIKNDQRAFESVIEDGADLHAALPKIDGKEYTVAEGMAHFERPNFIAYLQSKKVPFIRQEQARDQDMLSLSIPKNNPELLELLIKEGPKMGLAYGKQKWTLMHMASALCSHKLTAILHEKGKLNWDLKAKDGSTPLTLAAEHECLPMLGYWKEQKADFNMKDGRGRSALSILRKKKDAALAAFAQSFESRRPAAEPVELDFYRKRKIPKDQLADHSAIVEPEIRPIEAIETADISEFSD